MGKADVVSSGTGQSTFLRCLFCNGALDPKFKGTRFCSLKHREYQNQLNWLVTLKKSYTKEITTTRAITF